MGGDAGAPSFGPQLYSPAMRGFVCGLGIAIIVLWVALLTVWLASNTVVAVYRARVAVDKYAEEQEGREGAARWQSVIDATVATSETIATDTAAIETPPTLEEDLATIRAAEMAEKNRPDSSASMLAKIHADEARKRIAASKKQDPN